MAAECPTVDFANAFADWTSRLCSFSQTKTRSGSNTRSRVDFGTLMRNQIGDSRFDGAWSDAEIRSVS